MVDSFQKRENSANVAVLLRGSALCEANETIKQDAGHVGDLKKWTVMSYDQANSQWVTYEDPTATDGTQMPTGIYIGDDILEADIQAGDIEDCPILVGDAVMAEAYVVLDQGTTTIDAVITAPTNFGQTGRQVLRWAGIYLEDTVAISGIENE